MSRIAALVLILALLPAMAYGHLCNDVFVQAKDNLAVKVDVRDGQLRIGKEASFNIYVLNTMDRDIVNINLEVISKEFTAKVTPGPEWNGFPLLKTAKSGGKKETFNVSLKRNPKVPDGKYKIELRLFNGNNASQEFRKVDLESSADLLEIPKDPKITVDAKASASEWDKAPLITDFYLYVKRQQYFENVRCEDQPRFRLSADAKYVYCLFTFKGGGPTADKATAYIAPSVDAEPVWVSIERMKGKVEASKSSIEGIEVKMGSTKETIECKIPREFLGLESAELKGLYANFTRETTTTAKDPKTGKPVSVTETAYWRGNSISVKNPVVFAFFTFAK
ncbi:MAG: hypothetical protein WC712_09030 [Candidatus Brocadiia bacterium]